MQVGPIGVLLEGGMDRDFGRFAMKLRYGQVAMKILRYGPIGETRAESPATGPARLRGYKKEGTEAPPFYSSPISA